MAATVFDYRSATTTELCERIRDYDCRLWDVWTGSTITGWQVTCHSRACVFGQEHWRRVERPTAVEAFEVAMEHWLQHERAAAGAA